MFASNKNRQVSQLVAYIVSKEEGIVRQSICLSALYLKHPHQRGFVQKLISGRGRGLD